MGGSKKPSKGTSALGKVPVKHLAERAAAAAAKRMKRRAFAEAYARHGIGARAAREAGYEERRASVTAAGLLRDPETLAYIHELQEARRKKLDVTPERLTRALARVAFADIGDLFTESGDLRPIHDIPEDARRAISGLDVEESGGDGEKPLIRTRKIRNNDRVRALELLAKMHGLLKDRTELSTSGDLASLLSLALGPKKE
jgi:phage terminase small subunit